MKRYVRISLAVVAVLFVCAVSGQAERYHGGGGGGRGWGPALGLGLGLGLWGLSHSYYYHPYYPYPYYGYYDTPPVIVQQPESEVYVQPPLQAEEPIYWYYCQDPKGYYPYVKQCPDGWMKVVPSPPQSQRKE